MQRYLMLAVVIAGIIGGVVYLEGLKPQRTTNARPEELAVATTTTELATSTPNNVKVTYLTAAQKASQYPKGKELVGINGYLNLPAGKHTLTLQELVGKKVIIVDFWTYSCINCQRTLPYMNAWYQKYQNQGLEIIGVETPEFDFEKDAANVQAAIAKFGIKYPVVQDNDYATWTAYNNRYWPHKYIIDIDGFIANDHIGEGGYAETEKEIQFLLQERADKLGLKTAVSTGIVNPNATPAPTTAVSPETYFGSSRNEFLGKSLKLVGSWDIESEYARSTAAGDTIQYAYQARHVYFVAHATSPITVEILRDGKPLTYEQAGEDVVIGTDGKSRVTISEARLYKLINEAAGDAGHILQIVVPASDLEAFTFTFG